MRRIVSLFLVLSLALCLFGCGQNNVNRPIGGGLDSGQTTPTDPKEEEQAALTLVYDPADSMNPLLALIIIAVVPLMVFCSNYFAKKMRKSFFQLLIIIHTNKTEI